MFKSFATILIFFALTTVIVFGIKAITNPHDVSEYFRRFRERKPSFAAPSFRIPSGPSNER
jgi:hypothetical protein